MRARAQKKKKKASGEVEEAPSPQPRAAEPPDGVANRRVIPDPQGPPVVAPVLMPAVMLADREGARAAGSVGAKAVGPVITPVVEAIMSVTAPPQPSDARLGDAHPPAPQVETQTPAAPTPQEDRNDDGDAEWRAPDEARLLVQSPRRLFLYWRFARDPRELMREALGPVAERLRQAVRLVDVAGGEEGQPAPAAGSDYWFDVLPGRLLRAEVGFHAEGLPFVRLISSNTVETPAVGVSRVEDEAPEFRVAEPEFGRVLEATGFAAEERPAEHPRQETSERGGDPASRSDPTQPDATTRTTDPPRPRASSDTARPTSSPRDGGHFSNTRGGGELF